MCYCAASAECVKNSTNFPTKIPTIINPFINQDGDKIDEDYDSEGQILFIPGSLMDFVMMKMNVFTLNHQLQSRLLCRHHCHHQYMSSMLLI